MISTIFCLKDKYKYFLDTINYSFVFLNTLFIYNCYSILSFVSIVNKL